MMAQKTFELNCENSLLDTQSTQWEDPRIQKMNVKKAQVGSSLFD